MTNTERLYQAMKRFTDTRREAREAYMQTMAKYQTAKGSPFYQEQQEQAQKERADKVNRAKGECLASIKVALSDMRKASENKPMQAPTEEQLRILQMLKMRTHVTDAELQTAANAMNGNGAALAIIDEIEKERGGHRNYLFMAKTQLSPQAAMQAIDRLTESCRDILEHSSTRAARIAASYREHLSGNHLDADQMTQEPPYMSEEDFYGRMLPSTSYEALQRTVN